LADAAATGTEVVLATRSAGKIRELREMLVRAGLIPLTLDALGVHETAAEEGIEVFATFEANAEAKARWFSTRCGGRLVLADDSGLAVDALGGAPGVRSKRFAAESGAQGHALDVANNAKLVRSLAGHGDRRARYVCVAVIASADACWSARGESTGVIVDVPRGDNGFGYDPFFLSDELGVTFGEASLEAKERISHRGRAVRAVIAKFLAVSR
jgi:XTP/dITP diphosphohydrolase